MSVIYLVLPLALIIAVGMVWAFVRSVGKGQFDDLDTPALRMLFDDQSVADRRREPADEPDTITAPPTPDPPRRP